MNRKTVQCQKICREGLVMSAPATTVDVYKQRKNFAPTKNLQACKPDVSILASYTDEFSPSTVNIAFA